MDKRKLKIIPRIFVSSLFVVYLTLKVDWTVLIVTFKRIDLALYLSSTLLAVASSIFVASKYYFLIKGTALRHSLHSLVKINFISRFYALFLPSVVGKEAVRWFKVTRNQRDRIFFLAATIFERLTFLFVLILFALIPLFFYPSHPEIAALRGKITPLVALCFSFISLFISYYMFSAVRSFFRTISYRILGQQWKHLDIASILRNFSLRNPRLSLYILLFGLSLVWQFLFLSRIFVLFKAASLPFGFVDAAWMGSLVLLLQILPVSFAGVGVREGAYAYFFTLYGLPPEEGVLVGILFFSQMLLIAGLGAFLEFKEN